MEESNYQPMETFLGDSIDEFSENNNNILATNSEENITYSQSEHELNINTLFKKKNEKIDDSDLLQEKLMKNINTLQSIRISHSLEKYQKSQSLIDIINGVKYDFADKEDNLSNNENDMNVSNKVKSGSKKEEESFRTNKCVNDRYSNSNCKNKNSLLSMNGSNLLNKNKTSAMTKYSSNNCNNKNNKLSNNNNYNSFNVKSNNNTDNNSNSSNKFKIEEIFKMQFEERIKPKSNKSILNCQTTIKSSRKNNKQNNKLIEKPKTLEYQNKIKKILSLFSSENNSNNFSNNIINKDLKQNGKDNSDKIIISKKSEKNESDDLINLNDSDLISPLKSKELIFSNIDNLNELSMEYKDEDEKSESNFNYKSGKKNGLIIDAFGSEDDSDENQDKNVMISELDIELSNSFKINKNKGLKNKNLSNEVIQKNNMKLEKAIELNIKKGQFINNNYKKTNDLMDKNNEHKKVCNNNKQNKNSDKKIIKKSPIFNKSVKKKIYPKKKISSYKNTKNKKDEKNNNHLKETNLLKKYKNSSFVKPKIMRNINHIKKNILVSSGSNCSLLDLNTSGNQKNNSIPKKNTFSTERNKKNQSSYSYTSYSHSKKKKIKNYYINRPYKKSNNCLSNYISINRNKSNYLKSFKASSFYSNNDTNRESFLLNIPNISTIENKNRHNNKAYKANSINNEVNLYKNNTLYNDINIYKKNISFNGWSKDASKPTRNNNSHIIKIMNNPTYMGNNILDNDKSLIKNKKKNDIPICNIKSKIPFKKKIMGKKTELYSNNTKIKNKINSENNVVLRSCSYQNQNTQNSNSSILNEITNNYIPKLHNPLSIIYKNNKKISNTIYNSFTNNIRNNIKNNSYKNVNIIKKQINNKKNNCSSFINDNDAYNIFKISYIPKKAEKTIINQNSTNSNKMKENILTEFSSITKNFPNIGKIAKNVRNNKKKRLINDKIINKTYVRNVSQKYNSSSNNSNQTNINRHKCKINSLMINNKTKGVINHNQNHNHIQNHNHNKTPNTSRNNSKNVTVVGPQHFHSILNKFRLSKLEKNKHN